MGLIFTMIIMLVVIFVLFNLLGQFTFLLLSVGWIIFMGYIIVSGFKDKSEAKETISQIQEKMMPLLEKHGQLANEFDVKYLGGHPYYSTINCIMKFFNEVIVLLDYLTDSYAEIYYHDITDVELVSKEHIVQSPTLGNFLIFGAASLAMQEQKIHTNNFIIISYSDSGINNKVIIKTVKAGEIYNSINQNRIIHNKEHGISNSIVNESNDISEQIRKLSNLKDEGILTEDEFQQKKTELLSKI